MIIVSKYDDGDYTSIQEAVDNAVDGETILIREGIYEERVTVTAKKLTIIGNNTDFRSSETINADDESRVNDHLASDRTVITYGLYAKMPSEDIGRLGTFRSYTMFIDSDDVTLRNITIETMQVPVQISVRLSRFMQKAIIFTSKMSGCWVGRILCSPVLFPKKKSKRTVL